MKMQQKSKPDSVGGSVKGVGEGEEVEIWIFFK